ncbi:thiamine phosphate synthase [Phenylobacterium sp.]|uniref:thiamine phosphate synthase n=1 Tax=Phenylobacterium sp. TaxID=1871053 RepID=UPI0039190FFF
MAISGGFWTMERTARLLKRPGGAGKSLPRLLFFTDPGRTPDPVAVARRLPRGAAVVYRTFGTPHAEATARALKAVTRERGLRLLIGQDERLAARVGADGVHLPERMAHRALALKRARPGWIVTAAAHSVRAARAAGPDAVVVSAVFPSRSPSAGAPMGPIRLAALVRAAGRPAYALGGVNDKTARRLLDAGLVGLAGVEGLAARDAP